MKYSRHGKMGSIGWRGPASEKQESVKWKRRLAPVEDVVSQISATLTDDQKTAIAWRDEREVDYLLGRY
jgi:hypothetical protein